MEPLYGRELMDEFLKKVENCESADIRIAKVYDASENMSPELELAIKQDYPCLFLSEIRFDGLRYTVFPINKIDGEYVRAEREGIDSNTTSWKYLKRMNDIPRGKSARYKSAERYVLVNDDTLTWEDLIHGMISNRFGDFIPFEEVFEIYDVK
ncbi:MAG: hypothetical protein K6F93_00375 [Lachnospiraceae bacterium]|nr:hypothetical protein [Lachnospiraceae bacterium]